MTKNVCTGDSTGAGWHLPSSIVWNYIDSYRYNIGCSSFYCGWRWYQRFILIVFGHFRPPRNNIFYIFITWVIFECIRLISYNGNNPIIKAVPNLPVKSIQQFLVHFVRNTDSYMRNPPTPQNPQPTVCYSICAPDLFLTNPHPFPFPEGFYTLKEKVFFL